MIDIESTVFSAVAEVLRERYEGIYVVGEPIGTPSRFPAVSLYEKSNIPDAKSQTAESRENYARLMYQCDVYSNLDSGKKQQARAIIAVIDAEMEKFGFIKTFGQPLENLSDTSIYRYVARYSGVIGRNNVMYTD